MDVLNLSETGLDILPDLSQQTIKSLNLSWNNICVLYDNHLPIGIEELNLEGNSINSDGLLQDWPRSLHTINLSRNNYYSLDEVFFWPASLRVLNLSRTNLGKLDCSRLPVSLEELDISHTFVQILATFPVSLKKFQAAYTEIKSLPFRCPDSLEEFIFTRSRQPMRRRMLPSYWGASLKKIDLNSTGIKEIPGNLPETLEDANFSNNLIEEIPSVGILPRNLKFLHLGKNKIRIIPSWVLKNHQMKFTIQDNSLTELPQSPNCLLSHFQWVGEHVTTSVRKIQKFWRIKRIFPRIRTWKRMKTLKSDLLALAMSPERAGRFEDISSEWKYVYKGP